MIDKTRKEIEAYYFEKGFYNANVNIATAEDTSIFNSKMLRIHVKKGRRVKVQEIFVSGNDSVKDVRIKQVIKPKQKKGKINPFASSKLIQSEYDIDPDNNHREQFFADAPRKIAAKKKHTAPQRTPDNNQTRRVQRVQDAPRVNILVVGCGHEVYNEECHEQREPHMRLRFDARQAAKDAQRNDARFARRHRCLPEKGPFRVAIEKQTIAEHDHPARPQSSPVAVQKEHG